MKYYKLIGFLLLGLLQSACVAKSAPLDSSKYVEKYAEVWDSPLIQIANLEYEGAFIISSSEFGFSTMNDAEGGMAYATPKSTAPRGSLFASGNFASLI